MRGPATVAFLGDVPDQRDARASGLGDLREASGYLADLSNAPCRTAKLRAHQGLDAVDHRQGGPRGEDGLDRGLQLGGREQSEALHYGIDTLGPSTDLARRLLAGHMTARGTPLRQAPGQLQEQRDLPIPGSPLNRTIEPGTRPPPKTRSISPIPLAMRSASALETAAMASAEPQRQRRSRARAATLPAAARARPSRPTCSRPRSPRTAQTTRRAGPALLADIDGAIGPDDGLQIADRAERPIVADQVVRRVTRARSAHPAVAGRSGGGDGFLLLAAWRRDRAAVDGHGPVRVRVVTIVSPGSNAAISIRSASGSSIWCWISRRSGRAPNAWS